MKSPTELSVRLRRQWEIADKRESRLLDGDAAWPIRVAIGRPKPKALVNDLDSVRSHVDRWRQVTVGEVAWQRIRYRATSEEVEVPVAWILRRPTDWIEACADRAMRAEFDSMGQLVSGTHDIFHSLFVRRRSLWRDNDLEEVVQAARLAMELKPGCAEGRPLRLLSLEGIDTKFFERHSRLVTGLLDARYDGEVSRIGLESFLGALVDGDHWLLVVDLDGSLLPFEKQRIRSHELADTTLPGDILLIVENESCQHQLPRMPGTVAVLGTGFDLDWINDQTTRNKRVGYWGDLDTWGLHFLSTARTKLPRLTPLMMTTEVYQRFQKSAVPEPVVASAELPPGLTEPEQALYKRLIQEGHGRLEQEFLPQDFVEAIILAWRDGSVAELHE
jgi:hypothetical protein